MLGFRRGLLVTGAVLLAVACGSDDSDGGGGSSSCASSPASCGDGKTCWVVNTSGKYGCLPAANAQPEGAACQNTVGQANCNAGLTCFPGQQGSATGTCQPFCAKDGSCTNGGTCLSVTLIGTPGAEVIKACSPAGTGGTGGTGGGAGSGGASGGAAGSGGSGGSTGGAAGSGGTGGGTGGTGGGSGGTTGGTGGASDAGTD